jgi:hypothetical protein
MRLTEQQLKKSAKDETERYAAQIASKTKQVNQLKKVFNFFIGWID